MGETGIEGRTVGHCEILEGMGEMVGRVVEAGWVD